MTDAKSNFEQTAQKMADLLIEGQGATAEQLIHSLSWQDQKAVIHLMTDICSFPKVSKQNWKTLK